MNLIKNIIDFFEPKYHTDTESSMDYVFVSTPQHSPYPNNGWEFNPSKDCYEIYFMQAGLIDKSTWVFYTLEKGGHDISFHDKESFNKFRVLNVSL